jgi:hypothetical protein
MPVIGFLHSGSHGRVAYQVPAFNQGLNENGYVEGQNVAIEYRWADGHYDRLPALVSDLVGLALAARHKMPAIYILRQCPEAGGLMSYGTKVMPL